MAIPHSLKLKAGEWVVVRSKEEILSTLDKNGRLDELPFMPQMLRYCGQKLRVVKRSHKLCDPGFGTPGRKMQNAVLLEGIRCDGESYSGCQMSCLIFWKEAWLKRAGEAASDTTVPVLESRGCTEEDVWAGTMAPPLPDAPTTEQRYVCQATQVLEATQPLSFWSPSSYIEDYASGNETLWNIVSSLAFVLYYNLAESGLGFGSAMRWTYDKLQSLRGKTPYNQRRGRIPMKARTPTAKLGLQPGELVRIKKYEEILDTVTEDLKNRGMGFHPELVVHCGKTFRVQQRVEKIMNEKTGYIMDMKTPSIVLEGAYCLGHYTKPLFCPRDCYPFWREIWLERVDDAQQPDAQTDAVCEQAN